MTKTKVTLYEQQVSWRRAYIRKSRASMNVHWRDTWFVPLANWINRHLYQGRATVKVTGPAGICARCMFRFSHKDGTTTQIHLEPEFELGVLSCRRLDLPPDTCHLNEGTILKMNLMDYPLDTLPEDATEEWFRERLYPYGEPNRV